QRAEPSERTPQPEQNKANQCEGPDEWVALRTHWDDLRANRIVDQHAAILLCRVSRSLKRSRSSLANLSLNQRWVAVSCALLLFPVSGKFLTRLFGITLTIPHAGIETGHGKQRVMRPALDDLALVKHDNLVNADDSRESMRDHQCGPVARHALKRILNFFFRM